MQVRFLPARRSATRQGRNAPPPVTSSWERFAGSLAGDFVDPAGAPARAAEILGLWVSFSRLETYWCEREGPGAAARFQIELVQLVRLSDAFGLRHRSWPIRCAINGSDALVGYRLIETALGALEPLNEAARLTALRSLVAEDPYWPPACVCLGEWLLRGGDFEGARQQARAGMALASTVPAAADLLYRASLKLREETGVAEIEGICLDDLSDRFCPEPFQTIVTASGTPGRDPIVYGCHCGAWLPVDLAQGSAIADLEEVWNGAAAREIRRSILDGDFKYCNRELCPHIKQRTLPKKHEVRDKVFRRIIRSRTTRLKAGPRAVQLSHDPSCNLACPSCRTQLTLAHSTEQDRLQSFHERVTKPLLKQTHGTVQIAGYGDPFGSKHYRRILAELNREEYPTLRVSLVTNAQLLTKGQWLEIQDAHPMIASICVSVDAATKETYERVRRPGKWEILIDNLCYLSELRNAGADWSFFLFFVVQAANYHEMPLFVELGEGLGADLVLFQRLFNLGAFSAQQFESADVADPRHPEHRNYLDVLADPRMKRRIVSRYNASM